MHYTGNQPALPHGRTERPTLTGVLNLLDRYEAEGITYNDKPVKAARQALARANELRSAITGHVQSVEDAATQAGRDYAAGKASTEDVVAAALAAGTVATDDARRVAKRLVEAAASNVEAQGLRALQDMTEAQWLAPIVPVVTQRVADANTQAEAVGIVEPRATRVGHRTVAHPWSPHPSDLARNIDLRHAWEKLGASLDALGYVYALPDTLRRWGYLPTIDGRTTLEDYRWLRPPHAEVSGRLLREFWLAYRSHGEPGLFSAKQMAEADEASRTANTDDDTDEAASA